MSDASTRMDNGQTLGKVDIYSPIFLIADNMGTYREFKGPQTTVSFTLAEGSLDLPDTITDETFQRKSLRTPQSCVMQRPIFEGSNQPVNPVDSARLIEETINQILNKLPRIDFIYTVVDVTDKPLIEAYQKAGFQHARMFTPREINTLDRRGIVTPKPDHYRNHALWSKMTNR
jgi:hypothetical protein